MRKTLRTFLRWVMRETHDNGCVASAEPVSNTTQWFRNNPHCTLHMTQADNGWVVMIESPYDHITGMRNRPSLRIVPDGENLIDHVAALMVTNKLGGK